MGLLGNYADTRMQMIQERIDALKVKSDGSIPINLWDKYFLMLKGIKGFWDLDSWDLIEQEIMATDEPSIAQLIRNLRSNPVFKEFYKLMLDLDELKKLRS